RQTCFFTTSRNHLSHKAATSPHTHPLTSIPYHCDRHPLLLLLTPTPPPCHTRTYTCFSQHPLKQPSAQQDPFP
ncbi:phosphoribosyl-AMP cyclohydrolase, partial [Bacillus altitudinis]|uniref:phosphoribosyl-AMP cyclohydrolase n=1 Tax=Bacillus altitudinis TaxID=293387 RepID=UPI003B518F6F